jgi:beta-phosphoglucomutase-like phosphatase (HAD superfamily)
MCVVGAYRNRCRTVHRNLFPSRDVIGCFVLPYDGEVDMFSGYTFDVEGTLVDSMPQNLSSLQEALEQAGFDIPMRPCNCTPASMATRRFRSSAASQRKQILRARAKIYETKYLHCVKAFGGVRDMFETLTSRGGQGRPRDRLQRPRTEALLVSPEHR